MFILSKIRLGVVTMLTLSSVLVTPLVNASELDVIDHVVDKNKVEAIVKPVEGGGVKDF